MRNRVLTPLHFVGIALYVSLILLPSLAHIPSARAQDDVPARVAVLEAQVAALTERVAQLEAALAAQQVAYPNTNAAIVYIGYTPSPTTNSSANLYSGPSTKYRVAGFVGEGQTLDIVGCSAACDWYAISGGYWIAAALVNNPPSELRRIGAPDQPTQNLLPTLAPATATPVPVGGDTVVSSPLTPIPTATPFSCDCSGNVYNCDSFDQLPFTAQTCFDYCKATVGEDIHDLDRDNDSLACEQD